MQAGQEEEVTQVGHCEQGYVKPGEEKVASEIRSQLSVTTGKKVICEKTDHVLKSNMAKRRQRHVVLSQSQVFNSKNFFEQCADKVRLP